MTNQIVTARLPGVPPTDLDGESQAFDSVLRQSVERYLQGFVTQRSDGALIGPFPAMQHFPQFGRPL